VLLGIEAVPGRMPGLPWSPGAHLGVRQELAVAGGPVDRPDRPAADRARGRLRRRRHLRHSWLSEGVDDEAVDAWLACIVAFMLEKVDQPTPAFASPWLAGHRRSFGRAAMGWLESRRR
jgi:hypothetical protein